jgi:hypothetical protein
MTHTRLLLLVDILRNVNIQEQAILVHIASSWQKSLPLRYRQNRDFSLLLRQGGKRSPFGISIFNLLPGRSGLGTGSSHGAVIDGTIDVLRRDRSCEAKVSKGRLGISDVGEDIVFTSLL